MQRKKYKLIVKVSSDKLLLRKKICWTNYYLTSPTFANAIAIAK